MEAERLAQQPHGRVVHVRQAPVGPLDGDGVGDPGEDRLQLVVRGLELAIQARVLEVEPAAVGQLLGAGEVRRPVAAAGPGADQREIADDTPAGP